MKKHFIEVVGGRRWVLVLFNIQNTHYSWGLLFTTSQLQISEIPDISGKYQGFLHQSLHFTPNPCGLSLRESRARPAVSVDQRRSEKASPPRHSEGRKKAASLPPGCPRAVSGRVNHRRTHQTQPGRLLAVSITVRYRVRLLQDITQLVKFSGCFCVASAIDARGKFWSVPGQKHDRAANQNYLRQ